MRLRHPLVGELKVAYESFPLPDAPDQMMVTYHAEPGAKSAEARRLLTSWGADATTSASSAPAGEPAGER